MPEVSVVMPVYNSEKFLKESIESVLTQTFTDFEFIIIDDGSTDNSVEIIKSYNDSRIRLIAHKENKIHMKRQNEGLDLANGKYVAIMHSDDISMPQRFQKQVDFLNNNPNIGIVGSYWKAFDAEEYTVDVPQKPNELKALSVFHCPFGHPTVMLRKDFLTNNNLRYDENSHYAEDYDLWVRALKHFEGANIPEVLLHYRIHKNSVSVARNEILLKTHMRIQKDIISDLGITPTNEEVCFHVKIGKNYNLGENLEEIKRGLSWLNKLYLANQQKKLYPQEEFRLFLGKIAYFLASNGCKTGLKVYFEYKKSLFVNKKGKKEIFKACFKADRKKFKRKILKLIGINKQLT